MKLIKIFILFSIILLTVTVIFAFPKSYKKEDDRFISYTVDPEKRDVWLYWKNDHGENFGSLGNLKLSLEKNKKTLVFAMNGGMYKKDNSPQGLYIEKQKVLSSLDTTSGGGNFYLKPNGVFYLTTNGVPVICDTKNFKNNGKINYATQSGPMLVIDGQIHPAFKEGSTNLNIRNGVGILPGNKVIFAMSKEPVNFYDFAKYFKDMGCKNALYLDGFVSRTYFPEKNFTQTDGDFGVIIGVSDKCK